MSAPKLSDLRRKGFILERGAQKVGAGVATVEDVLLATGGRVRKFPPALALDGAAAAKKHRGRKDANARAK